MEIDVIEHGTICLTKVYSAIKLLTDDNEVMFISMRDSGFEFTYQGVKYSAKEGVLEEIKPIPYTNQDEEDNSVPYDENQDLNL